jgi:hypothetical protein
MMRGFVEEEHTKKPQWTEEHQTLTEKLAAWISHQKLRDLVISRAHKKSDQLGSQPKKLPYRLNRTLRKEVPERTRQEGHSSRKCVESGR